MDEREVLIFIRNKGTQQQFANKTRDIINIVEKDGRYEITFAKNPNKSYPHNKANVQYFNQPEPLSIDQSIIIIKDSPASQWDSAVLFRPYICLFRGSYCQTEYLYDVEIIHNITNLKATQHLLNYYRYIASLIKLSSGHLDNFYNNKLQAIREDSVLARFVAPGTLAEYPLESPLIFPFGVNPSQRQAVIYALQNQISLIQGPPGTGKTQTILNIIANLLLRGKTVAIVSGNNAATANVYEKLEKLGIQFMAARLGNNEIQKEFFDQENTLPALHSWVLSPADNQALSEKLNPLSLQITELLEANNRCAQIKDQLSRLELEQQVFERHFPVEPINPGKWSFSNRWSTPYLLKFLAELEYYSQYNKITWPVKLRWLYKYKIYRFTDLHSANNSTIQGIVRNYYDTKSKELTAQLDSLQRLLDTQRFEPLLAQYTQLSLQYFKHHLAITAQGVDSTEFSISDYRKRFTAFSRRFPVVLSTTDSIINNKDALALFDYLIVDEASQGDLLSGVLAMSCAKNLIAVGDLKQLPHIPSNAIAGINRPIDEDFGIQSGYSYLSQSLLSSLNTLFTDTAPSTLLREHYRCHPRIIDFCNQKFYDGQLIVMTESDSNPFKVLTTLPGTHAKQPASGKSLLNQRELDVITEELLDKELKQIPVEKIGIATPYRAQAEIAKKRLLDKNLQVDTVYKFQGREKDIIIFSTTANTPNKFLDDPHLLNVAVSRAKERFIMVSSKAAFKKQGSNLGDLIRHIEYQSLADCIFQSTTVSIFDCLYKEYAEILKPFLEKARKKNASKYLSENLMATLLDDVLQDARFNGFSYRPHYALSLLIKEHSPLTPREKQYATHPNTHVDFMLFNKLDKLPVLAIEVDGYRFHALNEEQRKRDALKNSIFEKIQLPLVRFATNHSGERQKVEKVLSDLVGSIAESTEEQLESGQ